MSLAVVIHGVRDLRVEDLPDEELGPREVAVRIEAGGICGSDLHYYQHGGFGTVLVRHPMVLGHEIAGTVTAVGAQVATVKPGDKAAVNPALPCESCRYCLMGLSNHCLDVRFFGSAMRTPHVNGGFKQRLVADERQCLRVPDDMPLATAAFAEPLAVCLHAVERAGSLVGRRVLITGAGPIGLLTLLAARHAGAGEVVVTDVASRALATAVQLGADTAVDVAANPDGLAAYSVDKGVFDVVFEASGSPAALRQAVTLVRPRGILVLIGLGPEGPLPLVALVTKEVDVRGTFRFDQEFARAVDALASGRIDPMPLLTRTLPISEAVEAFELAGDRNRALKVQLSFAG
jgi:L-idonate 5-dehydrogenase